jgi:hypothetical protein
VPVNGATAVDRSTAFTLTFSADLARATITSSSVTLTSPAGDQPVTFGGSGAQLVVVPTTTLRMGLPYTLTIGTAVQGLGGEAMGAPIVVAVTTVDGAWGAENTISTTNEGAGRPLIAADAQGGAVVAWVQGLAGALWGARTDGTGTWSAVQPLGGTLLSADTKSVAVDGSGNGFVVWQHGASGPFRAYGVRFAVGGGWSAAAPIDAGVNAAMPSIAANDAGTAIATWSQSPRVFANRYTTTGAWGVAEPAHATDTLNVGSTYVGIDAAGNAITVWQSGISPNDRVNYARYVAGNGWASSGEIAPGGGKNPQVVVDAAGNAIAAWAVSDGVRDHIWGSRFTPAAGWGAPEPLETIIHHAVLTDLAGDRLGNAVMVFHHPELGNRLSLVVNRYRVGQGWAGVETLQSSTALPTNSVAAVDLGGNVHVTWMQSNAVWVDRYTPSGGWRGAVQLGAGGSNPRLAVSSSGRAYVAYSAPRSAAPFDFVIKVRQFE